MRTGTWKEKVLNRHWDLERRIVTGSKLLRWQKTFRISHLVYRTLTTMFCIMDWNVVRDHTGMVISKTFGKQRRQRKPELGRSRNETNDV